MSWLIPDGANSDHPGYASDTGPSWVASVVNAIGQSSYWNSTAIIVVWDDWGGLYDPVAPPQLDDQGGPGFRVPMLVISPYVENRLRAAKAATSRTPFTVSAASSDSSKIRSTSAVSARPIDF